MCRVMPALCGCVCVCLCEEDTILKNKESRNKCRLEIQILV